MKQSFNPKVSIVIPVYNGSNYLREAIDSALAQTYKNIEVIVINDGSNDKGKTDKICKSYGKKIRYFKKENGGVSSALNMGIEKMKGGYFSWLSHDDIYYPNKIEKQIKYLSKNYDDKKILFCDYELINGKGEHIQFVKLDHKELKEKPEYALLRGCINGITLLIPKSAFDKYGKFDETLKCVQDYDMWRRFMESYKFEHVPIIITKTRIHPLQDSNKNPNAITEGNELWISMIQSISEKRKAELEDSVYNFYKEMVLFLRINSPYEGAIEYCTNEMKEIYKHTIGRLEDIKVSVIIPFYNRIKPLLRCLDSLRTQTHSNLEILLINDGSTQNISELREYIQKDKRIKIINFSTNKGPATARNTGIENATGEYIAFLDSDDEFLPEKIEEQLTEIYLTKYNVSHTSYIRRNNKRDKTVDIGKLTGIVIPQIIQSCQIATPTVMVKTEYLKKNGFRFREDIRVGEDTCFWLDILRDTKLLGIDKALTIVNVNPNSAANNPRKHLEGLTNIIGYLLQDKEYSKYHVSISNLCHRYIEVSEEIASGKESGYLLEEKLASMNKVSKLFYLFKYQGISLTIKKIIWKYGPRAINKVKGIFNGKR
ncbi:glycosyltransferase [Patescibacteria group bacterium]|nr:glycosyltransferase [Patescibacteria group bacterium]